jgi:AcrR family transcriptional regulator
VADRSDRIIESASELFAERGFQGTSIDAIAERASVSRSLIFWHFDSKDGLLSAVVAEVGSRWVESILSATTGRTGLDALAEAIRARGRILREEPQVACLVTVLMAEALALKPDLAPTFANLIDALSQQITSWLEEAVAAGELAPQPEPASLARVVAAALEGATVLWVLDAERYDVAAADDALLALIDAWRLS